ncbi:NACHT, LRR and PYD domains-containing protein 1 homolog [Patiria miniata]|uniref:NACHT domain-containing protein n=1 Tax=Patiria miniata TaxID=46514 RepID=A0A913Z207_PATMI|nr:NACHT, LRR and PYD domains-containing protein 1 homolog [Patiria miniata]
MRTKTLNAASFDSPQQTGAIGNIGTISGSNNPIIVGSSGVNITNIFPLEGPGVPAPRPQQIQRQDQEPRPTAPDPSYQDVGNKTRDILKGVYKTTGSYVQLLPGVDNDQMHIAGIYTKVQLETREGVAVVTGQKGDTVNSTEYAKIFRLRTKPGELISRLIFYGMGGVGKSTIFDKIAFDWADEASEFLKRFQLVFLLKMCALLQESDIVDSTFDQLLDEDSEIAKDELDKFIQNNSNEVLILLDGFDEMKTETLDPVSFGSVLKALNRKKYRECVICVSTRPSHLEKLTSESLVRNPCTHVEVLGFTEEDVHEYVQKFYAENPTSGNALSQTIEKSITLREFATNPMLLLLMCLLWRDSKQLPETTSRLFTEAIDHVFTRKHISGEVGSKTVISIGQTALRGLMSANQQYSFQEDEFEPKALDLALKAGILTKQRVREPHGTTGMR